MLLLPFLLLAAPPDRLPSANPLPPPDATVGEVMAPVNALLAAIGAHDGAAVLAQVRAEGGATAAADGVVRHYDWPAFAARVAQSAGGRAERLTDPAVEVDGDVALVWSPYLFTVGGRIDHCGTDLFDLVREGRRWKVLNVTWTQRTTGCEAR